MSNYPFVEDGLEFLGWDTTTEFSEIALHGTPDLAMWFVPARCPFGIVPAFVGIAQPPDALVASGTVSGHQAVPGHIGFQESLQTILLRCLEQSGA